MNSKPDPHNIDAEHHIQLSLTQTLCDAVSTGADAMLIQQILDQLVAYSDMHFMSEQLLMRLSGYPDYEAHVLDHDQLMERLETVKQQYGSAGEKILTPPEAKAILAFLAAHISSQDRSFVDYYRDWSRRE
jgi:hemerythrin-like metal-binding protein